MICIALEEEKNTLYNNHYYLTDMLGCRCGIFSSTKDDALWNIRYLKLSRTTPEYIDVVSIEAWNYTTRIYALTTEFDPESTANVSNDPYPSLFPASNANDNSYETFAHTISSVNAYILFDFGSDVVVNKIRVIFRNNNGTRDKNVVLTATNNTKELVFQIENLIVAREMSLIYPSTDIIRSGHISNW